MEVVARYRYLYVLLGGDVMKLSGDTIKKLLSDGLLFRDGDKLLNQVGANSIDVTLGRGFKRLCAPKSGVVDLDEQQNYEDIPENDDGSIVLRPQGFALGTTEEYISLPADICARIDGRSSRARVGLVVQIAGTINAGMQGNITLELFNFCDYPICLRPGLSVAQIEFEYLDKPSSTPYDGAYQGQEGTTGSRLPLNQRK